MRVIRLAEADVVVHVRRSNEVLVAVPARLSESDVLAMASLLLTDDEFAELAGRLDGTHNRRPTGESRDLG
jgi:hypothetical protein